MKVKIIICMLLLFAMSGTFCVYAQSRSKSRRSEMKKDKASKLPIPSSSITWTPEIHIPASLSGQNKKFGAGNSEVYIKQWIVNTIQFTFGGKYTSGSKLVLLPDLKVELYLELPFSSTVFYGVQTIQNVVIDPKQGIRRVYVSLFVPPNYVYYMTGNKKMVGNKSLLIGTKAAVIILDKNNQIIGRRGFVYSKSKSQNAKEETGFLNKILRGRSNAKLPVRLLPREKTPWQWIEPELYELPSYTDNDRKTESAPPEKKTAEKQSDDSSEDEE